jgi:hypothetical protein
LQRKIIFDIQFNPYRPKWQTKRSKLAAKDIETLEFHQDRWNHYLMLGFFLAHMAPNSISNVELRQSYKVLHKDRVVPSTRIHNNIYQREYAQTVDATKKQL